MKTSNQFVNKIMHDITGINLTKEEVSKLSVFLKYETGNLHLFTYINQIYGIIAKEFASPGKFIVIPFVVNGEAHLNIQKVE